MKIYHYNPDTGEYLGEGTADQDPITGGWLIPAFATDKQPLEPQDGKKVIFVYGEWQYQDIPVKKPLIRNGVYIVDYKQDGDIEVPERPGENYKWNGTQWILDKIKMIASLNTEYDTKINALKIEFAGAGLANSTPEVVQAKQLILIQQRTDLLAEKAEKRSVIMNG